MGLFGLSRKEKDTWAPIVIQGIKPDMQVDDALLKNATESYICQHIRILEESARLVLESKNNKTREDRYELALQHFSALSKIRKYADKNQKKRIVDAKSFIRSSFGVRTSFLYLAIRTSAQLSGKPSAMPSSFWVR